MPREWVLLARAGKDMATSRAFGGQATLLAIVAYAGFRAE